MGIIFAVDLRDDDVTDAVVVGIDVEVNPITWLGHIEWPQDVVAVSNPPIWQSCGAAVGLVSLIVTLKIGVWITIIEDKN